MKLAILHSRYTESHDKSGRGYQDDAIAYVQSNIDRTFALLRRAGEGGADLAVTNEDFGAMGGYLRDMEHPDCFGAVVSALEKSVLEGLCGIAKEFGMIIAANEYETDGGGIYNTTKLIGRDGGAIGRYRKVHLPSGERFRVQPGRSHPVFKTDVGNIGFAVCYDMLFPEHCRILALNGADMIIHQSQGWFPGGPNKNVLGEPFLRVRAAENRVYMVVSKNIQDDGGMSCVVDNRGDVLASQGGGENVLFTDIEPDYDLLDENDYDNYFAGLKSLRARHLLHREPSTYGRLLDAAPDFTSEALSAERMCTYDEWVELIKKLGAMTENDLNKMHW